MLTPVSDRVNVPQPVLLTVFGLAVALVPGVAQPQLDPGLILPVVLPPLLFAATQRTTAGEFREQRRTDPAAGCRAHPGDGRRGGRRRPRRRAAVGGRLGARARWCPRRTRSRPPRWPAGCGCRTGWSPSSRARACSTTPRRSCLQAGRRRGGHGRPRGGCRGAGPPAGRGGRASVSASPSAGWRGWPWRRCTTARRDHGHRASCRSWPTSAPSTCTARGCWPCWPSGCTCAATVTPRSPPRAGCSGARSGTTWTSSSPASSSP